jgi:hypothetical protein
VGFFAFLGFLLELVEASLEPKERLQKHVMIGDLVARVGIGQEWLEALPDHLDTGELLIAELDVQLVGRLVGCLGHGEASSRCGMTGGASILCRTLLIVKAAASDTCTRCKQRITPPVAG